MSKIMGLVKWAFVAVVLFPLSAAARSTTRTTEDAPELPKGMGEIVIESNDPTAMVEDVRKGANGKREREPRGTVPVRVQGRDGEYFPWVIRQADEPEDGGWSSTETFEAGKRQRVRVEFGRIPGARGTGGGTSEPTRESPSLGLDDDRGEIVIECNVPGAVVTYDGGMVAGPAGRFNGPSGRLVSVVVQAPGRASWSGVFRIEAGVRLRQRVALSRSQPGFEDAPQLDEQLWRDYRDLYHGQWNVPGGRWTAAGAGALGVGIAVLGGYALHEGISLLQNPREQYRYKCDLMPCEQRFDMRSQHWQGVAFGGVMVLVGGWLGVLSWRTWNALGELEQLDLRIQADATALGIAVGGRL